MPPEFTVVRFMDEAHRPLEAHRDTYLCPGESRPIDRAVHLARLAAYYPPCRDCACRRESGALLPLEVRQWTEIERRASRAPCFTAEGLAGSSPGDVDPQTARRLAGALAQVIWRRREAAGPPPVVFIGADGHWTTAELVAAACEALQLAGCRAVETGTVTTASLTAAAGHKLADAALWIGNASGEPHAIGCKLWGPGGRPWSSPGDLDAVRQCYESSAGDRPQRRGGEQARANAAELYLPRFASGFHGLRPLRFVLDTLCEPGASYWRKLSADAACQTLRYRSSGAAAADRSQPSGSLTGLAQRVVAESAHFGLWISGDGEVCRLVDERGEAVDSGRVFSTLARYVCGQQPGAALVVERPAGAELLRALSLLEARVTHSDPARQAMFDAMTSSGAVLGGGPSGRLWFSVEPPAPDALVALSLLLTMLSQSDRPLSEVLDAV